MSSGVIPDKLFEGLLTEEGEELCAMLDGASVPGLLERFEAEPSLEVECLFRGGLEPGMAEVAPYLVKLDPGGEFARWVVGSGWGHHWGSFVTTRQGFLKLRNHLRGLTLIYRRDGTPLYFRYYDPRVLRMFLPTCSSQQLRQMFGPVDAFLAESETGDALSIYRLNGDELSSVQRKIAAER
ncbi:MAG TPA: DUF4123 domain-containing protein [Burkholderiales bacterium]|jgi:hypothetical protein